MLGGCSEDIIVTYDVDRNADRYWGGVVKTLVLLVKTFGLLVKIFGLCDS